MLRFFFILLIALFLSILIGIYVFPVYFHGDDVNMLLEAKYFSRNVFSVFSLSAPAGQIYKNQRMLMWYYYRPLERLLWVVSFMLFGLNPTPLHVIEIFLFIISLYGLFKITDYLAGLRGKMPAFLCIFVLLILFYPFDKVLLTFLSHSNTFLMLFFMSLSLANLLSAYYNEDQKRMSWGIFLALLAFISKEWSFYALPAVPIIYFYLKWKESNIAQRRIILKTNALLFAGLTATLVLQFLFRNNPYAEKASNLLSIQCFLLNTQYFISINSKVLPLFILSLFSLPVFRDKGQITSLLWSGITLIPALLYKNLCVQTSLHYFFLPVTGLSVFIGISVYLLINELYLLLAHRTKIEWYKEKYFSNIALLFRHLVLMPLILCYTIYISFGDYKYFKNDIKSIVEAARIKKQILQKASLSQQNSMFFVTDEFKQKDYEGLLYLLGRSDVQIKVLDAADVAQFKTGENLIKNNSFESDFEGWTVNFKRMVLLSDQSAFSGRKSVEVDLGSLSNVSSDFVELTQDIKVKPGQPYIFGGRVNLSDDFNGHFWIEIRDKRHWRYGNYAAASMKEPNIREPHWTLIQNYFVPTAENLMIIACRGYAPVKGKIRIDGIFLYPVRISILD
ncbi:MAG: carbohydrate binding domain-containing protein [Candidatus Omnitrophota bacterium]